MEILVTQIPAGSYHLRLYSDLETMESKGKYLAHTVLTPDPEDPSIVVCNGLDSKVPASGYKLLFKIAADLGYKQLKYVRIKNGITTEKLFQL